jgi:BatD DUF11 like domain
MVSKYFILHIILFFSPCIICQTVNAQVKSPNGISVNTSVSRTRIIIGEQLQLKLILDVPENKHPDQWPLLPDSINHMEVVERGVPDSLRSDGRIIYSQTFTLTSFDSGHWVIPPIVISTEKKIYKSDSIAVDVGAVVLKGNDYNDIKEIIEVPAQGFNWKKWLPYIIGTIILLILVVYWWRNRKKPIAEEKPVSRSTAFEEAVAELKKLKLDQLPEKGEMKQYYSRLYDIYRVYLGRYTGKKLLQSTTDDLFITMKDFIHGSGFSNIAEVLRIADAVKFAKYPSSAGEATGSMETVEGSVRELNLQKT